jgi:UDP-3-O-[3-hydroxymyristoyl] glucosamine N-acyltransferase
MADARFFSLAGPFTAAEIARRTGARIAGGAEGERLLRDVAPLETAGAEHLSFLDNRKYVEAFRRTRAGAAFVHPDIAGEAPAGLTLLVTERPYHAYARAAQAFYPATPPDPGIAPSAVVDPSARIGEGTAIEAHAVIAARVELGRRCWIGANSVIGTGCVLGDDVRIDANVTVSHSLIGARVRLYPGVRVGQDGFGFAPDPAGHVKVPQLGRVIIEDDVEIGANTTIDRGAGPDTVIGAGTMIDNLVQIGHNVQLGRGCVLVSQVGISGRQHPVGRFRDDRRAGRLDRSSRDRHRRPHRRPGRGDARCRGGRDGDGQPGAADQGIFPPGDRAPALGDEEGRLGWTRRSRLAAPPRSTSSGSCR